MWRMSLVLLMAGLAACSSSSADLPEPDPFADAEPVEGGMYAELPEPSIPISGGLVRFMNDEWKQSVAGWSFTSRAVGRWAQRDWDRLFGKSE